MSKRKGRWFANEFKQEAVRPVFEGGKTVGEVARDLDLTESAVRGWVKQAGPDTGKGAPGICASQWSEKAEGWRMVHLAEQTLAELFDKESALDPRKDAGAIAEIRAAIRERYAQYTWDQLQDAYSHVNETAFPERAKMLRELIEEGARKPQAQAPDTPAPEQVQVSDALRTARMLADAATWAAVVLVFMIPAEHFEYFMVFSGPAFVFWGVVHRHHPESWTRWHAYKSLILGTLFLSAGLFMLIRRS